MEKPCVILWEGKEPLLAYPSFGHQKSKVTKDREAFCESEL
jgi:hypothetical protein